MFQPRHRYVYDRLAPFARRCPFILINAPAGARCRMRKPQKLAQTIADMALRYVVITSVDRDDLRDGGAQHFADCITAIRAKARR